MARALAEAAPPSYDEGPMRQKARFTASPKTPRGLKGEFAMATYIMLANFTEQGIKNVMDTPKRAEAVKAMAKKAGVTMKEVYWTLGAYDVVAVYDAPDDASMTALGLSIGKLGNVRTQTLRAFTAADMKGILGKVV